MRSVLLALALVLLVATGTALAAHGDPQKRITPADQARARAMLLRPADFSVAYTTHPTSSGLGGDFYCAALDESDLTLTGQAQSPSFTATAEYVTSTASVYRTRAESNASWNRGTSKAGQECLREGLRGEFQGAASRLVSFRRIAFPQRGDRSVAFQGVATQQGIRVYLDVVAIQVSRSQTAVVYITALGPPPQGELRRLTGLVAKRAASAMRGA
jgi:hypothetical protein